MNEFPKGLTRRESPRVIVNTLRGQPVFRQRAEAVFDHRAAGPNLTPSGHPNGVRPKPALLPTQQTPNREKLNGGS